MIVVYQSSDILTKEYIGTVTDPNVLFFQVDAKKNLSLGELRNYAIQCSNGEYFCQWDDDDWNHNQRLEIQIGMLKKHGKPACVLAYWLLYDAVHHEAYLSFPGTWGGSVLCRRDIINDELKYPAIDKSEDHAFIMQLARKGYVFPVVWPTLYIYVYHGKNTWGEDHFFNLFGQSQQLSCELSNLVRDIINRKYPDDIASELLNSSGINEEMNYFYSGFL
ncbi:glycosyltransferase family A protein [Chitinophaga oryzae]|nr:glycosyltransferase family A protein [Chitinophaga oryzae]